MNYANSKEGLAAREAQGDDACPSTHTDPGGRLTLACEGGTHADGEHRATYTTALGTSVIGWGDNNAISMLKSFIPAPPAEPEA